MVEMLIISESGNKTWYRYENGRFVLERILNIQVPLAYGIVPATFGVDGEPIDGFVICSQALKQGTYVNVRIIGFIRIKMKNIFNDIILAVPEADEELSDVKELLDIPRKTRADLEAFVRTLYEDVRQIETFSSEHALRLIKKGYELYKRKTGRN